MTSPGRRIPVVDVAACILFGKKPAHSSSPGAATTHLVAPGPLTAENAPVVLKPVVKHKRKAAK